MATTKRRILDDARLERLAREHGTPLFVYDAEIGRARSARHPVLSRVPIPSVAAVVVEQHVIDEVLEIDPRRRIRVARRPLALHRSPHINIRIGALVDVGPIIFRSAEVS